MRVNPSKYFPENIGEIRPDDGNDCEERGGQFFRGLRNPADYCVRLVNCAEASLGGPPVASLAARAEVKARTLICAA